MKKKHFIYSESPKNEKKYPSFSGEMRNTVTEVGKNGENPQLSSDIYKPQHTRPNITENQNITEDGAILSNQKIV